jgi:glycosyltransferase involved in cell wall biosynthesis
VVVSLMPHPWHPFVLPWVRRTGVRYVSVIHDASAHPGDETGILSGFMLAEARRADLVVTLSDIVREQLIASGKAPADRIVSLFMPHLSYVTAGAARLPAPGEPFRFLFLGRIRRYKGLGMLVEAFELLRRQGVNVELSICGEGSIEPCRERLLALGANVINRWLSESEIAEQLAGHHAVVLSHIEASQSGVAAAAFGAGLPVIATPVGGLSEQVAHRVNGILAEAVTPQALAAAVAAFVDDPKLVISLRNNIRANEERSMRSFLQQLLHAIRAGTQPG